MEEQAEDEIKLRKATNVVLGKAKSIRQFAKLGAQRKKNHSTFHANAPIIDPLENPLDLMPKVRMEFL